MSRFIIEGVAHGIPRQALWDWYTDFRSDDNSLIEEINRARDMRVSKREIQRKGNRMHYVQDMKIRGNTVTMAGDATFHPADHTYDIRSTMTGWLRLTDERRYVFTETPEGTKITATCTLRDVKGGMKLMNALGILPRIMRKGSQEAMDGYLRAAMRELGGKGA